MLINSLFEQLNNSAIRYCHFKSNIRLGESFRGDTDFDMYVLPDDYLVLKEILEEYKCLPLRAAPHARYPDIEDWILYDPDTQTMWHLHIHKHIYTGKQFVKPVRFVPERMLLESSSVSTDHPIPTPLPAWEVILLAVRICSKTSLLKRLTQKHNIPPELQDELVWLLQQTSDKELEQLLVTKLSYGRIEASIHIRQIRTLVTNLELEDLRTASRIILDERIIEKRMPRFVSSALSYIRIARYRSTKKINNALGTSFHSKKSLPSCGAIIAVLGSDGAGKSTLTHALRKWLAWKIDVRYIYLGKSVIHQWLEMIKPTTSPRTNSPALHKKKSKLSWLSIASSLINALSRLITVRRADRLRRRGFVVICDRYPQNIVYGANDGPGVITNEHDGPMRHWAAKLESKIYSQISNYQPNLTILLSIDPETAHHRKPDHNLERITEKIRAFDSIKTTLANVHEIDSTQHDAKEVLHIAQATIWNCLHECDKQVDAEFVGIPGSGKTTLAWKLHTALVEKNILHALNHNIPAEVHGLSPAKNKIHLLVTLACSPIPFIRTCVFCYMHVPSGIRIKAARIILTQIAYHKKNISVIHDQSIGNFICTQYARGVITDIPSLMLAMHPLYPYFPNEYIILTGETSLIHQRATAREKVHEIDNYDNLSLEQYRSKYHQAFRDTLVSLGHHVNHHIEINTTTDMDTDSAQSLVQLFK